MDFHEVWYLDVLIKSDAFQYVTVGQKLTVNMKTYMHLCACLLCTPWIFIGVGNIGTKAVDKKLNTLYVQYTIP
jgi:hypothetical protein